MKLKMHRKKEIHANETEDFILKHKNYNIINKKFIYMTHTDGKTKLK